MGVSILLILSFLIKNYQFSKARFKANASIFLYEESQIYVFKSKYNKKIQHHTYMCGFNIFLYRKFIMWKKKN